MLCQVDLPTVVVLDETGAQKQIDRATTVHHTLAAMMGSPFLAPHNADLVCQVPRGRLSIVLASLHEAQF